MIITIDIETTGDGPSDRVIEVAVVSSAGSETFLVNPDGTPVTPGARAVHHISDEELATASSRWEVGQWLQRVLSGADYVAAHSADFDVRMLRQTWPFLSFPPVICTWKCARHLWPDAPGYGNQHLRYWLGLDVDPPGYPHRALYDAEVTRAILGVMLRDNSPERLVELTGRPVLLKVVGFGKHRGELWCEVPLSYLRWILSQDFDEDVRHTAEHYLDTPHGVCS